MQYEYNQRHKNSYHLKERILSFILIFFYYLIPVSCYAQDIQTSAAVDTNAILIGDWIHLTLKAEYPSNVKISLPQIKDSLKGLDIVNYTEATTQNLEDKTLTKQDFVITSFDSGTYLIPAFDFQYLINNDTILYSSKTNPIEIYVQTLNVDTSAAIKEIKLPLGFDLTFADMLPYIIGIALLLLIGWVIYQYIKKRKRKEHPVIIKEPSLPPHRIAIQALRELEEKKLWQQGKLKQYHTQLTDILRIYIERQFHIPAMELTSDEIIYNLNSINIAPDVKQLLNGIFTLADLVKFAKMQCLPSQNEASINNAYTVIKNSIHQDIDKKEEVMV